MTYEDNFGKPYKAPSSGLKAAMKRAGISGCLWHSMRHTFGSRLGMADVDLRTVQEMMGHKNIAMTMRYAHPSPEHKRAAVEKLPHNSIHNTQEMEKASL